MKAPKWLQSMNTRALTTLRDISVHVAIITVYLVAYSVTDTPDTCTVVTRCAFAGHVIGVILFQGVRLRANITYILFLRVIAMHVCGRLH